MRTTSLKAKCGRARFNPLVHHARSCDDNPVQEVGLTVPTALNAWRAGPDCSVSSHKVIHDGVTSVKGIATRNKPL
jgi:hypothetical protein